MIFGIQIWLRYCLLFNTFLPVIFSSGSEITKPTHHTDDGFMNNYLPKEKMSKGLATVFKWRFHSKFSNDCRFRTISARFTFPAIKSKRGNPHMDWSLDLSLAIPWNKPYY
jgi:hypothetical protein